MSLQMSPWTLMKIQLHFLPLLEVEGAGAEVEVAEAEAVVRGGGVF